MTGSDFVAHSQSEPAWHRFAIARPRTARLARAACLAVVALLAACADRTDTAEDTAAGAMAEGAAASEPGQAAASANATLASYELDMDAVDKYFAAFRNMATAMQQMTPEERQAIEFDASDTDFDGYVARLESQPVLSQAIRDAGLTPREFSLVLWSMLQAGMANAVIQSQPNVNEDSLATEMQVNLENVRFIREHEAELRQKQEALDAEMQRMGLAGEQEPQ